MEHILKQIEKLNAIGIALSAERNNDRLLELILDGAQSLLQADGGTFYSLDEEKQALHFEFVTNNSLHLRMGGSHKQKKIPFPPIPLYKNSKPNAKTVVAHCVHKKCTINIADAYDAKGYDFSGTRDFDALNGYRTRSILTIPMKNHRQEIIGVLQLINPQQEDGSVTHFSSAQQQLAESLASQAAVAITNQRLILELKALFEALIQLIATAIDDKSPYTGDHCRRVPELTMMLAEAASATDSGPLRDFSMNDDDRYELHIAGWLHDCGKISVPEHVMDKATKLEKIFDRIQEIDTRFEILKRDAEIVALREHIAALGGSQDPLAENSELKKKIRELDAERNFLRHSNIGGEWMSERDQKRIRDIGQSHCWTGADGSTRNLLSDEEIASLSIAKGTLTAQERKIINNHIVTTIKMLETLPFPRHLKRVPEYAGGHHERMDGKGYPKGLTREQLSIPARVMAIADIFEALTARDRPYKVGRPISECLKIMGKMKLDNHIDPDLFDVLMDKKVYREYARKFLEKEQIDAVNIGDIPGYTPPSQRT